MEEIAKLLEKRRLREFRGSPLKTFYEKLSRAKLVLDFVQSSPNDLKGKRMKSEARRQFIVSLITAFETYIGDIVVEMIDDGKISSLNKNMIEGIGKKYNLVEINDVLKNKITIGELICDNLNFQRLDYVFKFLTSLFNRNFPRVLEDHKFKFKNKKGSITSLSLRKGSVKNLQSLFKSRHDFVHDISFRDTPSYSKVRQHWTLMKNVTTCIDVLADQFRYSGVTTSNVIKK